MLLRGRMLNGSVQPYSPRVIAWLLLGGNTMTDAGSSLSGEEAERLRSFERQRHDTLAATYRDFFTPITALALEPLLRAAQFRPGSYLLDVATGPGCLAA